MKDKLLEWLKSSQVERVVFTDDENQYQLTITPKWDHVRVEYNEPKPIRGMNSDYWNCISKITIRKTLLEDCVNYEDLADSLYQKLLKGGKYEV